MRDRADYAKKTAAKKAKAKAEIIARKAREAEQLPEGQAAALDRASFVAAG